MSAQDFLGLPQVFPCSLSISKERRADSLSPSRLFLKARLSDILGKSQNLWGVGPPQGAGSNFPLAVDLLTLQTSYHAQKERYSFM